MFRSKTRRFILYTFVLSWFLAGLFAASHLPLKTPAGLALALLYMYMPALSALIVQRQDGERLRDLGVRWTWNRWFWVAWLFGPLFAVLTLGASLLMPDVSFSPGMEGMFERFADVLKPEQLAQMRQAMAHMPVHPFVLALGQTLIAGITVNAVAAFGEEVGWRGLLFQEWLSKGFWRSSWEIGALWGIWHAPLILMGHNYPHHPVAGVAMMVGFCLLLAPLFAQIRLASGSVLAVAIAHGTLNASGTLAQMLIRGGDDLWVGLSGLAGLGALLVLNLVLALWRWGVARRPAQTA